MATEKDKTKAAAVKMYLDEHPALGKNGPVDWEQIEFAMRFADVARADAIEECAKIAENEKVDAAATGMESDESYNLACEHIAFSIRRSLSRKQEEPR